MERTLVILKPDAIQRGLIGQIINILLSNDLHIVALKMKNLTIQEAKEFYAVHKGKPFYDDVVSYMASGPIIAMVLEGENAVLKTREIMGATNPINAAEGTIRKQFGISVEKNTIHGSDCIENANKEIHFFFSELEITTNML